MFAKGSLSAAKDTARSILSLGPFLPILYVVCLYGVPSSWFHR